MKQAKIYKNKQLFCKTDDAGMLEVELNAWLEKHKEKGTFGSPEEYEVEIQDVSAQVEQQKVNAESLAFLAATDFYIIRELDNGVPCPAEIKAQRQAAREKIIR